MWASTRPLLTRALVNMLVSQRAGRSRFLFSTLSMFAWFVSFKPQVIGCHRQAYIQSELKSTMQKGVFTTTTKKKTCHPKTCHQTDQFNHYRCLRISTAAFSCSSDSRTNWSLQLHSDRGRVGGYAYRAPRGSWKKKMLKFSGDHFGFSSGNILR